MQQLFLYTTRFNPQDWIFVLRILLACVCGAAIGMERKSRLKEAGLKTHVIVAVAAALMMVISKYGFYDVLNENIKLDPSRIGAGVATAVSFLGAGIIFMRKDTITGLTTAAGLWATVGVGMAAGSGLYLMAMFTTLIILGIQVITHRYPRIERADLEQHLLIRVTQNKQIVSLVEGFLMDRHIEILSFKVNKDPAGRMEIEASLKCPQDYDPGQLFELFELDSNILSIEL